MIERSSQDPVPGCANTELQLWGLFLYGNWNILGPDPQLEVSAMVSTRTISVFWAPPCHGSLAFEVLMASSPVMVRSSEFLSISIVVDVARTLVCIEINAVIAVSVAPSTPPGDEWTFNSGPRQKRLGPRVHFELLFAHIPLRFCSGSITESPTWQGFLFWVFLDGERWRRSRASLVTTPFRAFRNV